MLELALRLVFSLAVVLGLLLVVARIGSRRFRGGKDSLVHVVHRQHLTRGSSVSVVTVGTRVLVLGTTEHQVRVLAELDPEEIADHVDAEVTQPTDALASDSPTSGDHSGGDELVVPAARALLPRPAARSGRASRPASQGPLTGSVLSVDTWRQAIAAATRRAS